MTEVTTSKDEFFDDLKDHYKTMKIADLAAELKRLKGQMVDAKAAHTQAQTMYDFLSISVLPEIMDDIGVELVRVKDVGRLQLASDIRCSCPADAKDGLQDWLEEKGHGELISSVVNASTLKAFVKEQMKMGNKYPQMLKVEPFTRATVVKA